MPIIDSRESAETIWNDSVNFPVLPKLKQTNLFEGILPFSPGKFMLMVNLYFVI